MQKLRRAVDTGDVARAQPVVDDLFGLGQPGDQRPAAGFETAPGVTHDHPFLMPVLVQQRQRIHIQCLALPLGRQAVNGLGVQSAQCLAGALIEHAEKPAQGGLASGGLETQYLGHRRITLQPGHAGKLVRAAQDAADIAQRDIGGLVRIGPGVIMRHALLVTAGGSVVVAESATRQSGRHGP